MKSKNAFTGLSYRAMPIIIMLLITGCSGRMDFKALKSILPMPNEENSDGVINPGGDGYTATAGTIPNQPLPDPAKTSWTDTDVDTIVAVDMVKLYAPVPAINGAHPGECDFIHYLRFRPKDPAYPNGIPVEKLDAIVLTLPGLSCGSAMFGYIARQWVYMAKTIKNANIEVWVYEPRAGGLADNTGMNAAKKARAIKPALDYYFNGKTINGRKFSGFLEAHDMPYLSDFGLSMYMNDLYTIMTANIPDRNSRKQKLFLAGHCMGGFLTHLAAGWDFDGNPATTEDAGYNNFAGLVNLDGAISGASDLLKVGLNMLPQSTVDSVMKNILDDNYNGLVKSMRTGGFPIVINNLIPFFGAKYFTVMELAALNASFAPDEESTLLRDLPYSINIETALRILFSKNWPHFLSGIPSMKDLRLTNETLFGLIWDNNSGIIASLQAGMGFFEGGEIAEKKFPTKDLLAYIKGYDDLMSIILSKNPLFIPGNAGPSVCKLGQGPLYRWVDFDRIPDVLADSAGMEITRAMRENSGIQDFAGAYVKGPLNMIQWYFPLRILVDLFAANLDSAHARENGLNFFYTGGSDKLPKLEIICDMGPFYPVLKKLNWKMMVVEGYNHVDPVFAACNRRDRREGMSGLPVLDFILE